MKAVLLGAALLALALSAGRATAATAVPAPHIGTLTGVVPFAIDNGPGDQTDPHVSGRYVSYTSEMSGDSAVRVYNLATQTGDAVPRPDGGLDFLSDVSGSTVTYTRLGNTSAIYQYDPSNGAESEVDASPSSNRRESRAGGGMIVWQDFGYTNDVTTPEIAAYDTATGATTRLTWDSLLDKDPAVAPDGNTIVWTKCQTDGTDCTIWAAQRIPGGWGIGARTSVTDGEASLPDTDGRYIVYSVVSPSGDEDIEWQPVDGVGAHELALPGQQTNANVSNGVITFEQLDTSTQVPNYDVWAYDIATNTLYRLTDDPEDETLNDVSVNDDRMATVVWTKSEADDNVYGEAFTLPALAALDTTPPTVSVDGFTDGQLVVLGAPRPVASCASSDDGSGVVSTTGPTEQDDLTANGVGTVTVTCTATDGAGNTGSATKTYRIGYAFGGFLAPVGGAPAVNTGHAGRAYPLKWQLTDANGNYLDALSAVVSIRYRAVSCDGSAGDENSADATSKGNGGLTYDAAANEYAYTWATPKTGGCYALTVTLDSGQSFDADFRLS